MTSLLRIRTFVVAGFLSAAPVAAAASHSDPSPPASAGGVSGFEIAFRGAVAFPFGDISNGSKLNDHVTALIPFQLDVGARFSPFIFIGGFFQYAPGVAQNCKTCTLTDLRAGGEMQLHLMGDSTIDPWLGVGGGYEWLHTDAPSALGSPFTEVSGFDFADLQFGINIQASRTFGIGPYAGATLGRFRRVSGSATIGTTTITGSTDITNQSLHTWLTAGLRVVFDIR